MRALKTAQHPRDSSGVYALKVIDVLKNPQLAEEDKILATPTLSKICRRQCVASSAICRTGSGF